MAFFRQRVDFKVNEFIKTIGLMGYWCRWEKAAECPCLTKGAQGQPDFNCPLCKGKGRYWYDSKSIQGIMTGISENVRYNQTGEIAAGTNYFTTLPEHKLGLWDRLTFEHSQIRFSEIVEKKEHNVKDSLRFKPTCVSSLRTVAQVYQKDVDFTVDPAGYINWEGGGLEPNRGERYSVDYTMHPPFIVIDMLNVIRDTIAKVKKPGVAPTSLPVRVLCKLEFYVS